MIVTELCTRRSLLEVFKSNLEEDQAFLRDKKQQILFQLCDPDSWLYIPREADELNELTDSQLPEDVWNNLFERIPTEVLVTITKGHTELCGWAATEMVSPLDPEESSIGDIYYIIPPTRKAPKRLAYSTCEGNALTFSSLDSIDWGQVIIPNLRPLSVSLHCLIQGLL